MKRIATVAATIALATPGAAMAAGTSSTCQAYNSQLCSVTHHRANDGDGTLPFTGLDAALLAVGGGTLLGSGFLVRRLSGRQS
jgi:hypothetical protein